MNNDKNLTTEKLNSIVATLASMLKEIFISTFIFNVGLAKACTCSKKILWYEWEVYFCMLNTHY